MAVVKPHSHRRSIIAADAALRTDDQDIPAREVVGIPPHSGIDGHAEDVPAR